MSQIRIMCQKIKNKKSFGWWKKMGKIMKNKGGNGINDDEKWQQGVWTQDMMDGGIKKTCQKWGNDVPGYWVLDMDVASQGLYHSTRSAFLSFYCIKLYI